MNKSIHRCPYDDSREPSLIINWPEKTFQCMNCGVRGDVGEIEQILIPRKDDFFITMKEAVKPEPAEIKESTKPTSPIEFTIHGRKFKRVHAISKDTPCIGCMALLAGGPACGSLPDCWADQEGKEREQFIFQWVED